jgi:hypothetical protein
MGEQIIINADLGPIHAGQGRDLHLDCGFELSEKLDEAAQGALDLLLLHHIAVVDNADGALRERHLLPVRDLKPIHAAHERDGAGAP